jgi:hypothetical protein
MSVNVHAALINHAAYLTPEAANAGGDYCWDSGSRARMSADAEPD